MSKKFTMDFVIAHKNNPYKVYTAKSLAEASGVRYQWIATCIECGKMNGSLERLEFIQFWEIVMAWVPFVLDELKKTKQWIATGLNCDISTIDEIYNLSKLADKMLKELKDSPKPQYMN
jgi:hypothetical protein